MIRDVQNIRVNSTGRQRILREAVSAKLSQDGNVARLSLALDLNGLSAMPTDAQVSVDLYRRTEVESFILGTVGDLGHLDKVPLERFTDPTGAFIRVRIVSTAAGDEGRLLAFADKLRPEPPSTGPADTKPLLPFRGSDALEDEVWSLEIGPEGPIVLMNSRLASWNAAARSPHFVSLVYPEIMRRIGLWLGTGLRDGETAESGNDSLGDWLRFARELGVDLNSIGAASDEEDIEKFAASCARRFSSKTRMLDRFNQLMEVAE